MSRSFDNGRSSISGLPYQQGASNISFSNGVMTVTAPGDNSLFTAQGKVHYIEQVGVGTRVPKAYTRMQVKLRVVAPFRVHKRTSILQIAAAGDSGLSPPIAVYLSGGGEVKCVDYNGARGGQESYLQKQNISDIPGSVGLADGEWHTVELRLFRSETAGHCQVIIDGRSVTRIDGIDSMEARTPNYFARIGIYRDRQNITQAIQFDNWIVQNSNAPLW